MNSLHFISGDAAFRKAMLEREKSGSPFGLRRDEDREEAIAALGQGRDVVAYPSQIGICRDLSPDIAVTFDPEINPVLLQMEDRVTRGNLRPRQQEAIDQIRAMPDQPLILRAGIGKSEIPRTTDHPRPPTVAEHAMNMAALGEKAAASFLTGDGAISHDVLEARTDPMP